MKEGDLSQKTYEPSYLHRVQEQPGLASFMYIYDDAGPSALLTHTWRVPPPPKKSHMLV